MEMKEELELIGIQLDMALEYGLELEVIYYALKAMKENTSLSPAQAFALGVTELVK
jgi:hypothetical protein